MQIKCICTEIATKRLITKNTILYKHPIHNQDLVVAIIHHQLLRKPFGIYLKTKVASTEKFSDKHQKAFVCQD